MSAQAKFNYSSYFLKILHPIHPDMRISKDSKEQINLFVNLIIDKLTKKAIFLTKNNFSDKKSMRKPKTLSDKDFASAVEIILNGELRKLARVMGARVVRKYAAPGTQTGKYHTAVNLLVPTKTVDEARKQSTHVLCEFKAL